MQRTKTTVLYQYMESHRNGVYNFSALLRICEVKYIENFWWRHCSDNQWRTSSTQYLSLFFIYERSWSRNAFLFSNISLWISPEMCQSPLAAWILLQCELCVVWRYRPYSSARQPMDVYLNEVQRVR
jgi:hypothetical protein